MEHSFSVFHSKAPSIYYYSACLNISPVRRKNEGGCYWQRAQANGSPLRLSISGCINLHVIKSFPPDLQRDEDLRKRQIRAARVVLDPPDEPRRLHEGPLAVRKVVRQVGDRGSVDHVNLEKSFEIAFPIFSKQHHNFSSWTVSSSIPCRLAL